MQFFKSAGASSNVTTPVSYQDQTAGYYTGGSLTMRTGSRNIQPATLQMPGFRAGCGGIDLWLGGMTHIGSGELVNALRSIGSSAASYAFLLGLQTVSPSAL